MNVSITYLGKASRQSQKRKTRSKLRIHSNGVANSNSKSSTYSDGHTQLPSPCNHSVTWTNSTLFSSQYSVKAPSPQESPSSFRIKLNPVLLLFAGGGVLVGMQ